MFMFMFIVCIVFHSCFLYSMREKRDWNGKGYYHLVTLGERSGKPDQSVPRTCERSEPIFRFSHTPSVPRNGTG